MKTCLFFLLMAAATALLMLGANLWAQTQAKIDAAEGLFVTLGTVEQPVAWRGGNRVGIRHGV